MKRCEHCNGTGTARSSAPHSTLTCRCSACGGSGKVDPAAAAKARRRPAPDAAGGLGFGPAAEGGAS